MATGPDQPAGAAGLSPSQVKSATRTLDIIEYVVATNRALVAQEIAVALGIPVSSLSYLLATLVDRGYLLRDGRRYQPGPGLERLQMRGASPSLADRTRPLVQWLRSQLNETASFFIRVGWEMEVIVTQSSDQALRYSLDTGKRLPMHALASGRALLASLPDAELERYFAESERVRFTPSTITAEKPLRREIALARAAGVADTDEEYSLGIRGIGCVVQIDGQPVGALSVAIPKVRLSDNRRDEAVALLHRACTMLETR